MPGLRVNPENSLGSGGGLGLDQGVSEVLPFQNPYPGKSRASTGPDLLSLPLDPCMRFDVLFMW